MEIQFPFDTYTMSDISISQLKKRIGKYPQANLWVTLDSNYILRMLEEVENLRIIIQRAYMALGGHCLSCDLPHELPERIAQLLQKYNAELVQNSKNMEEIHFLKMEQLRRAEMKNTEATYQNFNSNGLELIKSICNAESSIFSKTITPKIVMALVADLEDARQRISQLEAAQDGDQNNS